MKKNDSSDIPVPKKDTLAYKKMEIEVPKGNINISKDQNRE